MRSEIEITEHLEWFKIHCWRYDNAYRDIAIAQLSTLLWTLGDDPTAAKDKAEIIWDASRDQRRQD